MTQVRIAVAAGIVLLAGAAHATTTPLTQEEARVAAARHVGSSLIDLTRPSPEYAAAQQRALQFPDSERGKVLAGAGTSNTFSPSRVDDRFRR